MRLQQKLLLATLPALAALGGLGAYATVVVDRIGAEAEGILRANYLSIRVVQRMNELRSDVERLLLSPEDEAGAAVEERLQAISEPLSAQRRNITEPGEAELTAALMSAAATWIEAAREVARRPPGQARAQAYLQRVRPHAEELRTAAARIVVMNQDAIARKSRETAALAGELRERLVLVSLGALLGLVVIGAVVAGRVARPIVALTVAVRSIAEGDLDRPLPRAQGDDEVAVLVQEVGAMSAALREYRRSSLGELIAAQQLAQAAIDGLRDPVVSFGPDRRVRQVNEAAGRLLGIDPDRPEPLAPVPAELRGSIEEARDRVLSGRGAVVPDGLAGTIPAMVHGAARQLQVQATPTVLRGPGDIVGATVLVRDVTSIHAAAALKDDLLSTVAHELRTPLTSMRMAIHMCLEQVAGPLTEKQQELLGAGREDSERLHRLIEGILAMSRVEGGGLAARRMPLRPADLVEGVVGPLRIAAADRRLELVAEAPADPEVFVDLDSASIALGNIVQNALRHTPEGGRVVVRAARRGEREVRFEVRDSGAGIAPEHHARLFSRFYRVPGSPPGGTGLGLSITRDVVHAHGGEVGVESAPGQGSKFWFTLPVAAPGDAAIGRQTLQD